MLLWSLRSMLRHLKTLIRHIPWMGPWAVQAKAALDHRRFRSSRDYWERRYERGGSSGGGSYGRLARFKAEVLNDLVRRHGVGSVLELGCGDGHQLSLARFPRYVGLDVSRAAVERCRRRFADDASKRFFVHPGEPLPVDARRAEATLSLDVIFHLVEDEVFERYMSDLFDMSERMVVVYSSNEEAESPFPHVRHRRFTDWVDAHRPEWRCVEVIPNRHPSDGRNEESASPAQFYVFERDRPA
jgi:SAM-dependent methyltransferase